jgi:hypothetical protein
MAYQPDHSKPIPVRDAGMRNRTARVEIAPTDVGEHLSDAHEAEANSTVAIDGGRHPHSDIAKRAVQVLMDDLIKSETGR